jgi:glycosyltransferase involved in cell wall biosynthesis
MKKIAIIGIKGLPAFGGSARAGENLVAMLKDQYNFTFYTVSSHTDRKTGFYKGYEQIVFKKFFNKGLNTLVYYLKSSLHCLFKRKYDLIHVFHIDAAFIVPILKLKYKVIAGHRARPQESSKWNIIARTYFHLMEFIFFKIPAHTIVSVAKHTVDDYQSRTKRKMHYIPNGIIINEIENCLPEINYKDYILYSAGRIMETKGCHIFLHALKKINYMDQVIIIGNLEHDPRYIEELYLLAQELNVKFAGLIKDKKLLMSYIKNAKFAVYPTFLEGMSNMLLELASMKTPVICSDIPENTIVFNEKEALHFKTGDSNDLAEKINWALNHNDEMVSRAKLAYKKIEEVFNWSKIAKEYDKLYKDLLK